MSKEYNVELQKLFLEMMCNDAQSFVRLQNIYNPENFDEQYSGPLFAKDALVKSRNVPAVELNLRLKTDLYGVLKSGDVKNLREETFYGAGIVLGAVELNMEELLQLYVALAREGQWVPLRRQKEDALAVRKHL